jgi:predicted Zn-dependent protease
MGSSQNPGGLPNHTGTLLHDFGIALNYAGMLYAISSHPNADPIDIIAGIMAHELGHVLGLEDLVQTRDSIMHWGRCIGTTFRPTAFDVESVRIIYEGRSLHATWY